MEIANYDDVIDSRDVIARFEEMHDQLEAYLDGEFEDDILEDLMHDLKIIGQLCEDGADYASDWEYGAVLVRDDYFTDWAQTDAEDIYELPTSGPASYIDWEAYARDLQMDYTSVEFDGVTYWTR